MIDYNGVFYFLKVTEYESFSEAARRLKVPVSTVSRKVSELESELGVRLLERSTRKLRLTELGREYFERCFEGMEQIEDANARLNQKQIEVSGTVRLSVPPNIEDIIVPLISEFQALYPKSKVNVLITETRINLIKEGVDLAFRVGSLRDSTLIERRLLTYKQVLVASQGYITANGEPESPEDISAHRTVGFSSWYKEIVWKLTHRDGRQKKLHLNPDLVMNSYAGVLDAVQRGYGISEIPYIICHGALRSGVLVPILSDWSFDPTTLSAIYPSRRNISRLVSTFLDFSSQYLKRELAPIIK